MSTYKRLNFSISAKLSIKQVLFLTNSSASPDSQTNKAKIRDYKIAASYLRSTSDPHPDPHGPDSVPDPDYLGPDPLILVLILILVHVMILQSLGSRFLILLLMILIMILILVLILILIREDEQKVGSWEEAGKFYSVPGIRITLTTR